MCTKKYKVLLLLIYMYLLTFPITIEDCRLNFQKLNWLQYLHVLFRKF